MKVILVAFFALLAPSAYSQGWVSYKVVSVVDAETVILESDRGNRSTVRIAGIDAPETDQPFGKESTERLRTLLEGQSVKAQLIKIEGDRRMVSKLLLNDAEVGLMQIESGFAWHKNDRGELPAADALKYAGAEAAAKTKKVGLWAADAINPKDWRRAAATKSVASVKPEDTFVGIVDPKFYYPFRCDEARFDPNTPQRSFNSEAEAQQAGFKRGSTCSKPKPVVDQSYIVEKSQPLKSARAIKIIQMTSDVYSYVDKLVNLEGEISMSTRFVGEFANAERLFYSFRISDGTDAILVYAPKNLGGAKLRQYLLQNDDATIWTKVRIKIIDRTAGGTIYGSLIDFVVP